MKVKKRIFIGLSGGVDSAVSAALLKEEKHEVIGVFIKGWYPPELPCTWAKERRDAMRVAAHLGIPFHTLDASVAYKKGVIDYLIREYGAGRTPNPDIFCNRDVKFGAFYEFAKAQGAHRIATGHYARTENGRLYRAAHDAKDQSYFLWAVPNDALRMTEFPLGEVSSKDAVRALARKYALPVAEKKDSQGICFLGPVSMEDFLRTELQVSPGTAKDEAGRVIGRHGGAVLATLGERVALTDAPPGPWYVREKDLSTNTLVVSKTREVSAQGGIVFTNTHWFAEPQEGQVTAQYRYHGPLVEGVITGNSCIPSTPLSEPAAPGQSLVFYRGNECLGGGIIA
jgi:tRNA-uridine 2-sulfurtransferase